MPFRKCLRGSRSALIDPRLTPGGRVAARQRSTAARPHRGARRGRVPEYRAVPADADPPATDRPCRWCCSGRSREADLAEAFELDPPSMDLQDTLCPNVARPRRQCCAPSWRNSWRANAADGVSQGAWASAERALARVADEQQRRGDAGLDVLQRRVDELSHDAVRYQIEHYRLAVEAQPAARVVGMAHRGEAWRPCDLREAERALFGA